MLTMRIKHHRLGCIHGIAVNTSRSVGLALVAKHEVETPNCVAVEASNTHYTHSYFAVQLETSPDVGTPRSAFRS